MVKPPVRGGIEKERSRKVSKKVNCKGCEVCALYKECKTPFLSGRGKGRSEIIFVAEAPGQLEDERGEILCGPSGKVWQKALKELNIENYYALNVLQCRPPNNKTPTITQIKCCQGRFLEDLESHISEGTIAIVLMGGTALKAFDRLSRFHRLIEGNRINQ